MQETTRSSDADWVQALAAAEPSPPSGAALVRLRTYEDCTHAIDDLFNRALKSEGTPGFMKFLDFACRLNHTAVFNTMMVQIQRHGCLLAATRGQWAKVGRRPLPDAIPIVILRPFDPLGFVYDVDDTEGDPLPGSANPFAADGDITPEVFKAAAEAARRNKVAIEESDKYGSGLAGTSSYRSN